MFKRIKQWLDNWFDSWEMCDKEAKGYNCRHRPGECNKPRKYV